MVHVFRRLGALSAVMVLAAGFAVAAPVAATATATDANDVPDGVSYMEGLGYYQRPVVDDSVSGVGGYAAGGPFLTAAERLGSTPQSEFVDETGAEFTGRGKIVVVIDGAFDPDHPMLKFAGETEDTSVGERKVIAEACFGMVWGAGGRRPLCGVDPKPGQQVVSRVGPGSSHYSTDCAWKKIEPGVEVSQDKWSSHEEKLVYCHDYHGTGTASTAAGSLMTQAFASGIAKDAQLVLIKVGDSGGWGRNAVTAALEYVNTTLYEQYGDRIAAVNLSVEGGLLPDTAECVAAADPIGPVAGLLKAKNIAVVAASGNMGEPAASGTWSCSENVVTVGATGVSQLNTYTGGGLGVASNASARNELLAPVGTADVASGDWMRTGYSDGDPKTGEQRNVYFNPAGTSFAAPQVAGAFAVLRQKYGSTLTVDELVTLMRKTGVAVADTRTAASVQFRTPRLWLSDAIHKRSTPVYDFSGDGMNDFPVVAADWRKTLLLFEMSGESGRVNIPTERVVAENWSAYEHTTPVYDFHAPGSNGFITLDNATFRYHAYDRATGRLASPVVIGTNGTGQQVQSISYSGNLPAPDTGSARALIVHYADGQIVRHTKNAYDTTLGVAHEVVPQEVGASLNLIATTDIGSAGEDRIGDGDTDVIVRDRGEGRPRAFFGTGNPAKPVAESASLLVEAEWWKNMQQMHGVC